MSRPRDTATYPPLLNKMKNIVHISSKRFVSVTTPSPELCVLTSRGPWIQIVTSPFPVSVLLLGKVRLSQSPSLLISGSGSWPPREGRALVCHRKKKSTARASRS